MNEKSMMKLAVALLIAVVLGTLLGCATDRWIEVEPGEYVVVDVHRESNGETISGIETLVVDRESSTIEIELLDGSPIIVTFVAR